MDKTSQHGLIYNPAQVCPFLTQPWAGYYGYYSFVFSKLVVLVNSFYF